MQRHILDTFTPVRLTLELLLQKTPAVLRRMLPISKRQGFLRLFTNVPADTREFYVVYSTATIVFSRTREKPLRAIVLLFYDLFLQRR